MSKKEDMSTAGKDLLARLNRFTETINGLEDADDLPKKLTVRKVKLNLRPKAFDAEDVKTIRMHLRVSQTVFAEFLGVSASTMRDWEQGVSEPSGPVCRIIEEMSRDIEGWSKRIRELASAHT